REVGADATLQVTPYYNRPSQEGLYRHFKAIAEAAPLPVILYNVPTRTGCDLLADTAARLADVPGVVAIKEATGSTTRATQILARCNLTVLSGDDFTMFPLYAVGARGVISVLSNVAPRWVADMYDHVRANRWEEARDLHYQIMPLTELLFSEPSPQPIKTALSLRGLIADELRLPLVPTSGPLREKLAAALAGAQWREAWVPAPRARWDRWGATPSRRRGGWRWPRRSSCRATRRSARASAASRSAPISPRRSTASTSTSTSRRPRSPRRT